MLLCQSQADNIAKPLLWHSVVVVVVAAAAA